MKLYSMKHYEKDVQRLLGAHEKEEACYMLGLIGESGELTDLLKKAWGHGHQLDIDKLRLELGDCFWYVVALGLQFGVDVHDIAPRRLHRPGDQFTTRQKLLRLSHIVGSLSSVLDRHLSPPAHYYLSEEKFDRILTSKLRGIFSALEDIGEDFGLDLQDVLQANVEKLWKRYPNGFSEEASRARVDVNAPTEPAPPPPLGSTVTFPKGTLHPLSVVGLDFFFPTP